MFTTQEGLGDSEKALVEKARHGNARAFEALVARYQDRIYRLAARMSGNAADAEEITQETFLHAHRGLPSFKGTSQFGTWLYRIALNDALVARRSSRRRPLELVDAQSARFERIGMPSFDGSVAADDRLQDKALAARLRIALGQLEEPYRTALILRDLEELSVDEVAKITGVAPDTVRQRAHRARLKLREMLADLAVC